MDKIYYLKFFNLFMFSSEDNLKKLKKDINKSKDYLLIIFCDMCMSFRKKYPLTSKIPFLNWYVFKTKYYFKFI